MQQQVRSSLVWLATPSCVLKHCPPLSVLEPELDIVRKEPSGERAASGSRWAWSEVDRRLDRSTPDRVGVCMGVRNITMAHGKPILDVDESSQAHGGLTKGEIDEEAEIKFKKASNIEVQSQSQSFVEATEDVSKLTAVHSDERIPEVRDESSASSSLNHGFWYNSGQISSPKLLFESRKEFSDRLNYFKGCKWLDILFKCNILLVLWPIDHSPVRLKEFN